MNDWPAILGGTAIRPEGPPDWPLADADVEVALQDVIKSGAWGKYDGGNVSQLEAALASFHRSTHVLTCSSGTLAVELALRALQIGPGDEVILSAYDYEPNFLAVHAVGARPVLVDVAENNWNIEPAHLEPAVSKATRAIIVSHLHGGMVEMERVTSLARRHDIRVIEDAAQATGALVQGKRAGTWGDIGVLSFGGSKLLSAGRGGALLTNQPDLHQRLRVLLRRGVQQWAPLSELQAAVLLPQLAKLEQRNEMRRAAVNRLCNFLGEIPGLRLFSNSVACLPAYYKVGFQFDRQAFGLSREQFVAALRMEGIAVDAGFRAVHIGRAAGRFRCVSALSCANQAHHSAVVLHHPVLLGSEDDLQQVARAVHKVYSNVDRLAGLS